MGAQNASVAVVVGTVLFDATLAGLIVLTWWEWVHSASLGGQGGLGALAGRRAGDWAEEDGRFG